MPYVVLVALTVDEDDADRAVEFVRAELLSKLGVGEPVWQTEQPHVLPRWQVSSVRRATRQDEHGFPAE
jgi:hypothetical protein